MNKSIELKLKSIQESFDKIEAELSNEAILTDHDKIKKLNKERSKILPIVEKTSEFYKFQQESLEIIKQLESETDPDIKLFLEDELNTLKVACPKLEQELLVLLLPKDENEGKNVYLEVRAGTGGDEAALFASDLFRMYSKYLETMKIPFEINTIQSTGLDGIKEVSILVKGDKAYQILHLEAGIHRVQRVPKTETQGRIHTSACTVAVIPAVEETELVILEKDIRIDTYRSSGSGGQHVNTTDSAVRITHIPTGVMVSCQDEKSQIKNRAKAMSNLRIRLKEKEMQESHDKMAAEKKLQIGSGDRSEKIRTYNFPQNRLTDHRISYTMHNLDKFMEGDINDLVTELLKQEEEAKLAVHQKGEV